MTTVSKATKNGIQALSKKLFKLLGDKNGQIYQDNVARFGIPGKYVKKVFSEETPLGAVASAKSTIYLALESRCKILGLAQTIQQDADTTELDRIVVFPEYTGRDVGTQLLASVVKDEKRKGTKAIVVNAGIGGTHARRFYD